MRLKLTGVSPAAMEYLAMVTPIWPKAYREKIGADARAIKRTIDMRYAGQNYELPVALPQGTTVRGPHPEDGVRFEDVSFTYPGAEEPALEHITLHLTPGSSVALVGA